MKKRNPWLVESAQAYHPGAQTCTVADREEMVRKSEDIDWLRRVLTWPETQLTVKIAASARIIRLKKAGILTAKNAKSAERAV